MNTKALDLLIDASAAGAKTIQIADLRSLSDNTVETVGAIQLAYRLNIQVVGQLRHEERDLLLGGLA